MRIIKLLKTQHWQYYLLLGFFLCINPGFSQTLNFKIYTVLDGLANSNVYSTIQDSKGFLWIATSSGVNRFDGKTFETFTTDDGLADNEVLSIYEDSKGRIWFMNFNGRLGYYFNGKFFNPENNRLLEKATTKASIISCFEDSSNQLWFSTNQQQIIKIKNDDITVYLKPNKYIDISNCFIFEDDQSRIFAANTKGFYLLEKTVIKLFPARFLPSSPKSYEYNSQSRKLLFVASDGLVAFEEGRFKLIRNIPEEVSVNDVGTFMTNKDDLWISEKYSGIHVIKPGTENIAYYLNKKTISHTMVDRDKNVWVSTMGNGLILLPAHTDYVLQYTTETGLPENTIYSLFKEKSGKIWLGLKSGTVAFIDGKKISYLNLNNSADPLNAIKRFEHDRERNSVWFASNTALGEISVQNPKSPIRYLKEKNNLSFSMKSFSISKSGKLAFSLASGVYILDNKNKNLEFTTKANLPDQKFFPDRSFKLFFDSKERLWFSNINGLYRYSDNKIDTLSKYSYILSKRITDMIELPDGNMVIGTYGFGIVILKPNNQVTHISLTQGLTSNICRKLAFDGKYIWLTTFHGVDKFEYKSKINKIETYRIKDGLTSDEVLDIYIDQKSVYLGTTEGLTVIPKYFENVVPGPPLFYITHLTVNGRAFQLKEIPDLRYNQNNVSIKYTAINFSQSAEIYQYRLKEGAIWKETKNNTIEFGSLEPGDYKLSIRARVLQSGWSKTDTANFTIEPAYWQRWWFLTSMYTLGSILVVGLIYIFFKNQRKQEKEKQSIQSKIIALEQKALQAMMNPHFVFNIMNSIQYFINTQDSRSANEALTGFARLIRKNLEICTKSYISLEEELIYLKLYLSLEKLRFGDKMTYQISVSEEIDVEETIIPSMLLQPFVENAIWHGIMPKDNGGHILIHIGSNLSNLIIEIIDDGIGIDNSLKSKKSGHVSRGMQIIRDRVNLLNLSNKDSQISIDTNQKGDAGTCVIVKISF